MQHTLADATAGQPARERAEGILVTLLHEKVIHTLVTCTADAAGERTAVLPQSTVHVCLPWSSCRKRFIISCEQLRHSMIKAWCCACTGCNEAACSAAIAALAAAVHVPAAGPTSTRATEAFPLSVGLSMGGIAAPASRSLPVVRLRRPHKLLRSTAEAAGACLAERRTALRCIHCVPLHVCCPACLLTCTASALKLLSDEPNAIMSGSRALRSRLAAVQPLAHSDSKPAGRSSAALTVLRAAFAASPAACEAAIAGGLPQVGSDAASQQCTFADGACPIRLHRFHPSSPALTAPLQV